MLNKEQKDGLTDIINLLHTMTHCSPEFLEEIDGFTVKEAEELMRIAESIQGTIEDAEETITSFFSYQEQLKDLIE